MLTTANKNVIIAVAKMNKRSISDNFTYRLLSVLRSLL